MKLFLTVCAIAVLGALVLPFFMKVGGQPIMTVDDVVADATPDVLKTPTEVYKWQDEHGHWQFGETPPANKSAQSITVEEHITPMGKNWHGKPLAPQGKPDVEFEVPGIAAYVDGGKALMEDAKGQVSKLNERTETLERMRQGLN